MYMFAYMSTCAHVCPYVWLKARLKGNLMSHSQRLSTLCFLRYHFSLEIAGSARLASGFPRILSASPALR